MARGEVRTAEHGGQEGEAETLAALRTFEGGYGLRRAVDRPTKVPLVIVGRAEEAVRQRLQDAFPTGRAEHESALLRQMREGAECLLEVSHSLAVGGPRYGLLPRLPEVHQGLIPYLAP
jgi:hypothetical protein